MYASQLRPWLPFCYSLCTRSGGWCVVFVIVLSGMLGERRIRRLNFFLNKADTEQLWMEDAPHCISHQVGLEKPTA
ncbi:hypothetical protein GOBAR_DD23442 [Gossypium barbadense]|uniref:Uncharacterized protein n=1 Tax=Gossypium tomentosum TaxID=34277 RepID=A0A5D2JIX6_GOSTO|nr:hypothetical protein GOBAR_DD23442 [Gossypium barbadense]TYH54837.1 hypothetical protein ES332_D09G198400v1 [Gossypium tomentosum]